MKNEKITTEKKVLIAEAVFVAGVLIYLFFSTAPSQVYPLHGMTIIEPDFNIEIENGEEVLISTDENFSNLIILNDGSDITLPPGIYYWKVRSKFRESEIKSFEIKGHVGLDIKERPENYELQNSGNVDLNVNREKDGVVSQMELDVGEFKEVEKDDSKYEGEQK
ncbi:MAG: hypothetical protein ABH811_03095 [archaeon]